MIYFKLNLLKICMLILQYYEQFRKNNWCAGVQEIETRKIMKEKTYIWLFKQKIAYM